jgi:hypothetical protein
MPKMPSEDVAFSAIEGGAFARFQYYCGAVTAHLADAV